MRYSEFASRRPNPLDNPAFRRWFGRSRVVDAEGKPLVLFHGTAADIHSFRGMVWGSVTPDLAAEYAAMRDQYNDGGGNIMPIYMRIERPFFADAGLSKTVKIGEFFGAVMEQAIADNGIDLSVDLRQEASTLLDTVRACARREESGPHYDRHDFWYQPSDMFGSDGAAAIRRLFDLFGFDGVCMRENGELTFGAFSPTQVKSAIGNRGGFSADASSVIESG